MENLTKFVKLHLKVQKVSTLKVARVLGISPKTAYKRVSEGDFSVSEIELLLDTLGYRVIVVAKDGVLYGDKI